MTPPPPALRDALACLRLLVAAWLVTWMTAGLADDAADRAALRALLAQPHIVVYGVPIHAAPVLRALYAARDYAPLWRAETRDALVRAAAASLHDGLDPADYPTPDRPIDATLAPADRARLEVVLGESLARLAYSLRFGKANPRALDPDWNFARGFGDADPVTWLGDAIGAGDPAQALEALRPQSPYYQALKDALAAERLRLAEPWIALPPGPSLKPGARDPRVNALRARLRPTDAATVAEPELFDPALVADVQAFQRRHGLAEDGIVGRATLAALNTPPAARVETLRVNLERIRWIFHALDPVFVAINIAAFHGVLFDHGTITWESRVVVGRPYRRTPSFRSAIDVIELNPTWTVPPTILAQDILPAQRRDPRTLAKKKLQVLDRNGRTVDPAMVDWQVPARQFPYVLRQPPGPDNALGRIKFLFPNAHAVYLHDTPARDLFALPARSFSSGCIRLEQPFTLAERLLADDPAWSPAALATAIDSGKRQRIRLARPLPILLLYLTAFPDPDGALHYRADLYGRDPAVAAALAAPFQFNAPADYRVPESRTGGAGTGARREDVAPRAPSP
ncbi:MAG: murein L,D-transpeptidase [Gammaproteobacteria bacterium]